MVSINYQLVETWVDKKYIRKCEMDNLVLYKYTDKCTYEKLWNNETRHARGLILNKDTGEIVAYPFPKFFNLNEMPESSYHEIIKHQEYEVYDKLDGSLGISYFHNGKVKIATVGSFESEQAIEATNMLHDMYPELCKKIERGYVTYLFEIIYPSNKIVCNYNGERKLVMLAAFEYKYEESNGMLLSGIGRELEREYLEEICNCHGIPIVEKYNHTIDEMIALQKTLTKDKEGFVVRFSNGLRVKLKGDEYLRIHKIVTDCSPLCVWENMKYCKISEEVTMNIPEEYLEEFNKIKTELQSQYWDVFSKVADEFISNFKHYYLEEGEFEGGYLVFNRLPTPEERKEIGLYIKNHPDRFKHASCMFPLILNKVYSVDKYVMDQIRPDGNRMKGDE